MNALLSSYLVLGLQPRVLLTLHFLGPPRGESVSIHLTWDTVHFHCPKFSSDRHQWFGHIWYDVKCWWIRRHFHYGSTETAFATVHATQMRKDRWLPNKDKIQVTCPPSNHLGSCATGQRYFTIKDKHCSSHQLPKKWLLTKMGCFAY